MISIAVIGKYQIGKSSFVNALLNSNMAKTGIGCATTHANHRYKLSPFIEIYDTPGKDANGNDDETADKAIETADFIIYIHENRMLDDTSITLIRDLTNKGKPLLFLLNCLDQSKWNPDDKQNKSIVNEIKSQLCSLGLCNNFLESNGKIIHSINIYWALFSLGLIKYNSNTLDIYKYAQTKLELPSEIIENKDNFHETIMERSGFPAVRDIIADLPYRQLADAVANPQREINRFIAIFKDTIGKSPLVKNS
jgi:predicted GTPase